MTKDEAMEIIFSSPHYRELMEALEEAKKQLSSEEWQEVSRALTNDVNKFVTQRMAELSEGVEAGKSFRA
jgi:hypothetical protein